MAKKVTGEETREIKEKSRLDLRLSFLYHNHSQNNPLRFLIKELAKEEVIKVVTEGTVAVKAARKEATVIKRGIKEGTKVAKEGINGTKGEVTRGLSRKAILAASASSLPAYAAPCLFQLRQHGCLSVGTSNPGPVAIA